MKRLVVDNIRTDRCPLLVNSDGNLLCKGTSTGGGGGALYISEDSGVTDTLLYTFPGTHFLTELFQTRAGTYIGLVAWWSIPLAASQFYIARSTDLVNWANVFDMGYSTWLRDGICEDDDGNVYIGEYNTVEGTTDIRLLKSMDDGQNWTTVYLFTELEIRHIHCIQFDPYTGLLWMGCGDSNAQSRIGTSLDGTEWTWVDQGSQRARTCGFLFTESHVNWGMDTDVNPYMVRYNRATGVVETTSPCRYEVMWHHKWEPSGVLMSSNAYDRPSTSDRNTYFYLSENDGASWYPTLGMMPSDILGASALMWNWTKQDWNGYMYSWFRTINKMARISLVDIPLTSKAVSMPRASGIRRGFGRSFRM